MDRVEQLLVENDETILRVARRLNNRLYNAWREAALEIEDLRQIGRIAVWKAAVRWVEQNRLGNFEPYAYVCAYNAIVDHIRSLYGRRGQRLPKELDKEVEIVFMERFHDDLSKGAVAELVRNPVFSKREREFLLLCSMGYSGKDISVISQTTESNVSQIKIRLRTKMERMNKEWI